MIGVCYKTKFKEIYNKNKYNFQINNNMLSNIITKWKNKSNRFSKATVWDNTTDYQERLILREFRIIFENKGDNKKSKSYEYIIWANEENINRIRKSNHLYIDCTFHHPKEFKELLIVMYKDIITNFKIAGIYALLNNKTEYLYDKVFESMLNIITLNRTIDINIMSVITDSEIALSKWLKNIFQTPEEFLVISIINKIY